MASILNAIFARPVSVRIYGLGAVVTGLTGLVWGKSTLSYALAIVSLLAGSAMQWQRTACLGAVALVVPYCLLVVFIDVPAGFAQRSVFVAWYGVFENLALAATALIICTYYERLKPAIAERLSKIARLIFGICLIYFGLAHHFYLAFTISLVPAWLPPSQIFWAYATAAAHVSAGIAIISGIYARPAAMWLAAMFIVFAILVHAPRIVTDPHTQMHWAENAANFALIGAAWVIAASIPAVRKTKT